MEKGYVEYAPDQECRIFEGELSREESSEIRKRMEERVLSFSELEEEMRRGTEAVYQSGMLDGREAACYIRDMIDWNYMKKEAAREYAGRVHLSQTYICRVFREQTGQSIGRVIFERRMEKAAELLLSTNLMVREVAERVGYLNFSYFCKRFRDYYMMTPNAFRRKSYTTEDTVC